MGAGDTEISTQGLVLLKDRLERILLKHDINIQDLRIRVRWKQEERQLRVEVRGGPEGRSWVATRRRWNVCNEHDALRTVLGAVELWIELWVSET